MKARSKWLLSSAVVLMAAAVLILVIRWTDQFRLQKIDFILWDRQHNNDAGLSDSELVSYIQECGASTWSEDGKVHIEYRTLFVNKDWELSESTGRYHEVCHHGHDHDRMLMIWT